MMRKNEQAKNMAINERQFLQQQSDEAAGALSQTIKSIGKNLGHSVDPRAWAKAHPWLTLSGAAVAGFVGISLIPRKQPTVVVVEKTNEKNGEKNGEKTEEKLSFWRGMAGHAFKIGSRWLAGALVTNVASKMAQDNSAEDAEEPAQPAEHR